MFSDLLFDYLNLEVANGLGEKHKRKSVDIKKDYYEIKTEEDSYEYGKPKGRYELISVPNVIELSNEEIDHCTNEVAVSISSMLGKITSKDRILIVGLGNRHISSDSLGAKVASGINITFETKTFPQIMAICPSVMGLTGIETVEIVRGIASRVKPTHVILIDSLCASNKDRLGRSIQITNTGICPGGGIGNNRKCIGEDIAPNVYSIGVPLLIYANTFVKNTFENFEITNDDIDSIMQSLKKNSNYARNIKTLHSMLDIMQDNLDNMIVSIKDIEECVQILARIISSAINRALGVE